MPPPLPYKPIAGVVPCAGGWLVQPARLLTASIMPEEPFVLDNLAEVIDYRPTFETIVLDVPIGIPAESVGGYRTCDRLARALLGWPRHLTVRPVPCRAALDAASLEEAQAIEPWVTKLSYRYFRHYREADAELQSYQQRRLFSANPELSFYLVNLDAPTPKPGYTPGGLAERLQLLEDRLPGLHSIAQAAAPKGATLRQVLNAAALLWTARRIAGKAITRLPLDPEWDAQGRRMELVR